METTKISKIASSPLNFKVKKKLWSERNVRRENNMWSNSELSIVLGKREREREENNEKQSYENSYLFNILKQFLFRIIYMSLMRSEKSFDKISCFFQ